MPNRPELDAVPFLAACRAAWGLVVLLAFAGGVAGQTSHVYVAPDGNDAWSVRIAAPDAGRSDGPFATPLRARDAVRG